MGFYTKHSPRNSWSPHFMITFWAQKSRNAGTPCIRLCNGDFEGRFQTSLQTRIMIIFIWKFISIIPIFLLFFAGVVKSTAFCTLLLLFQWVDMFELQFDGKMWLKHINLFEIAATVCKKQWIWQLLQKIEGKWV